MSIDITNERQMIAECPERVRPHPFNPYIVTGDQAYLYLRGLGSRLLDEIEQLNSDVEVLRDQIATAYLKGTEAVCEGNALRQKLTAMTEARDEACNIAERYAPKPRPPIECGPGYALPSHETRTVLLDSAALYRIGARIAELRKVGE